MPRFSLWHEESITLTPNPSPEGRGENKVLTRAELPCEFPDRL